MTGEKRVEADVVHVDGVTILTTLNKGRKMHELSTDGVVDVLREETGLVVVDGVYTPGARIC